MQILYYFFFFKANEWFWVQEIKCNYIFRIDHIDFNEFFKIKIEECIFNFVYGLYFKSILT
jgi:hypothetical protein